MEKKMEEVLKKIDPKQLYKLTKVTTINPDSRMVQEGDTVVGQAEALNFGDGNYALKVGLLQTSKLVEVIEYKGNFQIITKNSGYTLEKV
jgi:hypothetical protein